MAHGLNAVIAAPKKHAPFAYLREETQRTVKALRMDIIGLRRRSSHSK